MDGDPQWRTRANPHLELFSQALEYAARELHFPTVSAGEIVERESGHWSGIAVADFALGPYSPIENLVVPERGVLISLTSRCVGLRGGLFVFKRGEEGLEEICKVCWSC